MRRARLALMTLVASIGLPATLLGQVEAVAGCYDLEMGTWEPDVAVGEDSLYLSPPPRIRLDTLRENSRFSQSSPNRPYILRPAPGALPSIHRFAYWRLPSRDSVTMIWTNGFSGMAAQLARTDVGLQGMAESFWDFDRDEQRATLLARPVDCGEPLPEESRVRYDAPRGLSFSRGDSLRLGERIPGVLVREVNPEGRTRILDGPSPPFTGADSVYVQVDSASVVTRIWLHYPSSTDFGAFVTRLSEGWGDPTTLRYDEEESRGAAAWSGRLVRVSVRKPGITVPDDGLEVILALRDVIDGSGFR